jgi:hypothetical protein
LIPHLLLLELAYLVFTNNLPFTVAVQIQKENVLWAFHHRNCMVKRFRRWLQKSGLLGSSDIQGFLVNLQDKVRYRPLTLSLLGEQLLQTNQ